MSRKKARCDKPSHGMERILIKRLQRKNAKLGRNTYIGKIPWAELKSVSRTKGRLPEGVA